MSTILNQQLIDHIVSSYGLIEGKPSNISKDLVGIPSESGLFFSLVKETKDFNEVLIFLSEIKDKSDRHVIFQHTPTWSTMLSNSKTINSFENYQTYISKYLNLKNISVADTLDEKLIPTHVFNMVDEDFKVIRSIKSKNNLISKDEGSGFNNLVFSNLQFNSDNLTELVKAATQYDLTLNEIISRSFILLEQS